MPFQHYLPASFLGIFSQDTNPRGRERPVCVLDKRRGELFTVTAGRICGEKNYYQTGGSGWNIDTVLSGYEPVLHTALDDLIAERLDAVTWLGTAVEFVTALMTRGPDFAKRFEHRLGPIIPMLFSDTQLRAHNTNGARAMEQQRLRASVCCARWQLLETSGRYSQFTNDMGYTPFLDTRNGDRGIAVPISPRHVLNIIPRTNRTIAVAREGKWWPIIERGFVDDRDHFGFLRALAYSAQRFVIAPNAEALGAAARQSR